MLMYLASPFASANCDRNSFARSTAKKKKKKTVINLKYKFVCIIRILCVDCREIKGGRVTFFPVEVEVRHVDMALR